MKENCTVMKMKEFSAQVVTLFVVLLSAATVSPASAAPSLVFAESLSIGQYNSGLVSPVGGTEANVNMYYLASSAPTSRPKVAMTIHGEGFEPGRKIGFGIDVPATTEPWTTTSSPPDTVADEDGSFTYT
ncbi:MAG: hypothetical protein LBQ19_02130, partial [Synergistaceae bacterium]|nr:hypothetical protein [Synergistaceae bacterium]